MPACSFCKKNYAEHKGLTVFTFDGRTVHFCSSKCRRNADLGRDAKKINWVKRKKKVGGAKKKKVIVRTIVEKPRVEEVMVELPEKEIKEEVVDEDEE